MSDPVNEPVNAPDIGAITFGDPDGVIANPPFRVVIASVPKYNVDPDKYKLLNFALGDPKSYTESAEGIICPEAVTLFNTPANDPLNDPVAFWVTFNNARTKIFDCDGGAVTNDTVFVDTV